MDLTSSISNDSKELIAIGNFKRFKFPAILTTCFFLAGLIQLIFSDKGLNSKQILPDIFIAVMFLGVAFFFWNKVLDKRVKLIVNRSGIITNKIGVVPWDKLRHFHIKEMFFKGREYHFLFLRTLANEEHKIEITYMDKSFDQVRNAILDNSKNDSLIDLGFETNK